MILQYSFHQALHLSHVLMSCRGSISSRRVTLSLTSALLHFLIDLWYHANPLVTDALLQVAKRLG